MPISLLERAGRVNRRIKKARQDLCRAFARPEAGPRARTNPLRALVRKKERYPVKPGGEAI